MFGSQRPDGTPNYPTKVWFVGCLAAKDGKVQVFSFFFLNAEISVTVDLWRRTDEKL